MPHPVDVFSRLGSGNVVNRYILTNRTALDVLSSGVRKCGQVIYVYKLYSTRCTLSWGLETAVHDFKSSHTILMMILWYCTRIEGEKVKGPFLRGFREVCVGKTIDLGLLKSHCTDLYHWMWCPPINTICIKREEKEKTPPPPTREENWLYRGGIHKDQIAENLEIFAKRYSEKCLPSPAIDF